MLEQIIISGVSAIFGGIATLILMRYSSKSNEGKIKIFEITFRSDGKKGDLEIVFVNTGNSFIIVDYVVLSDKNGKEEKKRPTWELNAGAPMFYPTSKKMEPKEKHKTELALEKLEEIQPQDITKITIIDTERKKYKRKLPAKIREDIRIWQGVVKLMEEAEQS